ncbi:hypothetical protein HAHE_31220 [Haloferula helveola]|uniref:Uncharacterized protein n=1 Tax=Haloferula helveola TaxID=490095 RepID=A0ABN6H9D2_9BACT|nr:hypothetical protein HAHE_31220 [Haloferula helveola]
MKLLIALALCAGSLCATTISVVPVFEPLSLHGTDVDEAVSETGEALQATVMSRPMALSGAFPETLIEAVRTPHRLPSNDPNYVVDEANLLVLCRIGISAEMDEDGILVQFNVADLAIPQGIDLTVRQVLKLGIVAVRKTVEAYQAPQTDKLKVRVRILGTDEGTDSLRELDCEFEVKGS